MHKLSAILKRKSNYTSQPDFVGAVAYINYDKASSAAMAIENLHETILNDGKGPMVKVMFAEAPKIGQGYALPLTTKSTP